MLVDFDNDPIKSIYFLGAGIIDQLRSSSLGIFEPQLLFAELNAGLSKWNAKVSFDYYMLALDWLYLIDAIQIDERGDIVKCF